MVSGVGGLGKTIDGIRFLEAFFDRFEDAGVEGLESAANGGAPLQDCTSQLVKLRSAEAPVEFDDPVPSLSSEANEFPDVLVVLGNDRFVPPPSSTLIVQAPYPRSCRSTNGRIPPCR